MIPTRDQIERMTPEDRADLIGWLRTERRMSVFGQEDSARREQMARAQMREHASAIESAIRKIETLDGAIEHVSRCEGKAAP